MGQITILSTYCIGTLNFLSRPLCSVKNSRLSLSFNKRATFCQPSPRSARPCSYGTHGQTERAQRPPPSSQLAFWESCGFPANCIVEVSQTAVGILWHCWLPLSKYFYKYLTLMSNYCFDFILKDSYYFYSKY